MSQEMINKERERRSFDAIEYENWWTGDKYIKTAIGTKRITQKSKLRYRK